MSTKTIATLEDPRLRLLICGYTQLTRSQWNYPNRSVSFWRLYWNDSPGASICCEGVKVDLKPSIAVLVAPNTICSLSNTRTLNHLYIHFQTPARYGQDTPKIATISMKSPLQGISQSLIELMTMPALPSWRVSLVARSLVEMALSMIDAKMVESPRLDPRVLKVLSYVQEHLQPNTSNTDLAREARMSVSALNHLFKEQIGQSLQAYLRIKRIEKASLMLQFSEASIEQIAEESGFCDRYYFSRVFKAMQGIGPAAFRQSHSNPFVPPW